MLGTYILVLLLAGEPIAATGPFTSRLACEWARLTAPSWRGSEIAEHLELECRERDVTGDAKSLWLTRGTR